jgi:aldose 1-epimerase
MRIALVAVAATVALGGPIVSAAAVKLAPNVVELKRENFQKDVDGKKTDLYTLRNSHGMTVRITNYGAKIEQVLVPDRKGVFGDVVHGYETIDGVINGQPSMGAFVGRYANRIGGAKFWLDGTEYKLAANNGPNTLHGGQKGSRFQVFSARQLSGNSVEMNYTFKDMEENFPGTMPVRVVYTVTENNELAVEWSAYADDKKTVASFTSHAFWNLAGDPTKTILDHVMRVNADRFLPVNSTLIPNGELRDVAGTVMDFRKPKAFGKDIGVDYDQLKLGNGYDHHYALNKDPKKPAALTFAASAYDPRSGRLMEVLTTEPGIQLFSGNNLEAKVPRDLGKGTIAFGFRSAFCLEPSKFPDSPNQGNFPTSIVNPGEFYTGKIVYKFSAK